jgi:hypothetical protein
MAHHNAILFNFRQLMIIVRRTWISYLIHQHDLLLCCAAVYGNRALRGVKNLLRHLFIEVQQQCSGRTKILAFRLITISNKRLERGM